MTLPLDRDKLLHFAAGALAGLFTLGALIFPLNMHAPSWTAVAAAALAGAGKEAYDWFANRKAAEDGEPRPHDVDIMDFLATFAGGLLVAIPYDLITGG